MKTKKHYNDHRIGKKSFQVMLTPDEHDLVEAVKALRNLATSRDLLLSLCRDEMDRQQPPSKTI